MLPRQISGVARSSSMLAGAASTSIPAKLSDFETPQPLALAARLLHATYRSCSTAASTATKCSRCVEPRLKRLRS